MSKRREKSRYVKATEKGQQKINKSKVNKRFANMVYSEGKYLDKVMDKYLSLEVVIDD